MNADEIVKVLRACGGGDSACEKCPFYIGEDSSECRFNAIYESADFIESLQAQLAESQCREKAAVEDMNYIAIKISQCTNFLSGGEDRVQDLKLGRCDVCKGICHENEPCKFEWRAPQDGKG